MYSLFQQQEFWGHLPLFFFLAFWFFITIGLQKAYTRFSGNWKLFGLSTLSGVLLALAFPPLPFTFLMFVAFVPLLMVEHFISTNLSRTKGREAEKPAKWEVFKFAYHSFVLYNIITTYWVANTSFGPSFVAIFLNSFFMAIPFVLFHQTKQVLKKNLAYLAFIVYWITFEFLHMRWEISWSWLNIGNSFAQTPSWVQWYEYTGVFGGALWILMANVFIFLLLENRASVKEFSESWKKRETKLEVLRLGLWVLIPICISIVMYARYEDQGSTVEVVAIQPNLDPHYEKFTLPQRVQLQRFIELSQNEVTDSTDYLVFPETSFGRASVRRLLEDRSLNALKDYADGFEKLKIITGISAQKVLEAGEDHSRATRKHVDTNGEISYWEAYNAAIQLESGRNEVPIYFKSILVPGAEMLPYHKALFFLKPLADALGGSLEGYGAQKERGVFFSNGVGIGPNICYESTYGEYTTGYVRNGAQAIFIVTNDGWWDNTAGYRQHLLFARLRSIETRRSIARSANIGSSAFINQRGDISQATAYGKAAAIKAKIYLNNEITFYVRYGDLIGRLALLTTLLLLTNTLVKSVMKS
jgi:apolipoprotein N-acyltransferase